MTDRDHDDLIARQLRQWADELAAQIEPFEPPITVGERAPSPSHGRRLALVGIAAAVATIGLAAVAFHRSTNDRVVGSSTVPESTTGVTDSSAPQTTTSTQWFTAHDRVTTDALGAGGWGSGEVSADGMSITLRFIGAPPYSPADPCSADYHAAVVETSDEVTIRVDSRSPEPPDTPYGCDMIGFGRSVVATLRSPLDGRTVNVLGSARFVGDPAAKAEATAVPDGWSLTGDALQRSSSTSNWWLRTWKPISDDGDGCLAGDFITLVETDRMAVEAFTNGAYLIETRDIDGRQVSFWQAPPVGADPTHASPSPAGPDRHLLTWQTPSTAYIVAGPAACQNGAGMPFDGLVEFVRGLRVPSPAADSLGFTPLRLTAPPHLYRVVSAHYQTLGGGTTAVVKYSGQPGDPDLVLVINPDPTALGDFMIAGRKRWTVNGRTAYDVGEGSGGCQPDVCAVALQWDDRTLVSSMWIAHDGTLPADVDQESLVTLLGTLQLAPEGFFELGSVEFG